jgi:hypothetical protein
MEDILINIILISALFFPPTLLGIWFFGLRRYIAKQGKTRITAVSWGFSMWADWTVAWEIGKERRKQPFSVIAFAALHILVIIEIITIYTL